MHLAFLLSIFLVRKPVDKVFECFVTDKVELEKYNGSKAISRLWTKDLDGEEMLYFDP